ncbi:hypothetical protein KSP40_PGU005400 [Platanthera guangdongensis]|uniref:Uncharacterized protein n=1 Tax=Platanthera guangdongensis TaxID=2320717 RepID=A0ABR2M2Y0_9ASPA
MTGIIFWNCRGASKLASRAYLKELVRKHHPIVVFLLVTRKQSITRLEADKLIGRQWSFEISPSLEKSGARNAKVHGEPFLLPTSIIVNAILDSSYGNWVYPCNQHSTWSPLLDG